VAIFWGVRADDAFLSLRVSAFASSVVCAEIVHPIKA